MDHSSNHTAEELLEFCHTRKRDRDDKSIEQQVGFYEITGPAGQDADARSDIFAFGAMLYEVLTGKKAFEEDAPYLGPC